MAHEIQSGKDNADAIATDQPTLAALKLKPSEWALFLDIDGTLIDLAETPDGIVVPEGLGDILARISDKLDGALALVTGRSVALADTLFAPHSFPIAGLHGTERRDVAGNLKALPIPPAFERMKQAIFEEAKSLPGVLIEDKGAAIAAHFRQAPRLSEEVGEMMERRNHEIGSGWSLQRGKMVVEIRPSSADKGRAIEAFLEEAPFKGRRPLTIGDDVTDEAMFHAANRLGGQSIRIGDAKTQTVARGLIPSPAALRHMLKELAE